MALTRQVLPNIKPGYVGSLSLVVAIGGIERGLWFEADEPPRRPISATDAWRSDIVAVQAGTHVSGAVTTVLARLFRALGYHPSELAATRLATAWDSEDAWNDLGT